jgi:hypothetical protein
MACSPTDFWVTVDPKTLTHPVEVNTKSHNILCTAEGYGLSFAPTQTRYWVKIALGRRAWIPCVPSTTWVTTKSMATLASM